MGPKIASLIEDGSYKKNLLKIEVYFEEFNYELITESADYQVLFLFCRFIVVFHLKADFFVHRKM